MRIATEKLYFGLKRPEITAIPATKEVIISHTNKQNDDTNFDGAVNRTREQPSSLYSKTRHTAFVSDQGLGTCHVLHVPYLQHGVQFYVTITTRMRHTLRVLS